MYTEGSALRWTRTSHLDVFAHYSTNFYKRSTSVKCGLDSRHHSSWLFSCPHWNEVTSVQEYQIRCSGDGVLSSPKLVQFGPPSLGVDLLSLHLKNGRKIWQIINNSAAVCSISIEFDTEIDHMYKRSRSKGERSGSQRDITYQQLFRYKSWMDSLIECKFGENYQTTERNMWHMFKLMKSIDRK